MDTEVESALSGGASADMDVESAPSGGGQPTDLAASPETKERCESDAPLQSVPEPGLEKRPTAQARGSLLKILLNPDAGRRVSVGGGPVGVRRSSRSSLASVQEPPDIEQAQEDTPLLQRHAVADSYSGGSGSGSGLTEKSTAASVEDLQGRPRPRTSAAAASLAAAGPVALLGGETSAMPDAARRKTLIFSDEAEGDMLAEDTGVIENLQSWKGWWLQCGLLFLYAHFDAGLPILQDLYKQNFGRLNEPPWAELDSMPHCVDQANRWVDEQVRLKKADPNKINPLRDRVLYTKPTLLMTQYCLELIVIWAVAYALRGSCKDCFRFDKMFQFAPAGFCFGIQAVFGFFALGHMSSGAYSLYTQFSLIVITITWVIVFQKPISIPCWISLATVLIGLVGFNYSDNDSQLLGLLFVALKIVFQSFACIYAEVFTKRDPETLYIQMSWIKPAELVSTALSLVIFSACGWFKEAYCVKNATGSEYELKWLTQLEQIRQLGFYHHWNWLAIGIMFFNMGDTAMTATVAKKFDSVVKGVVQVVDLIYPTQVFTYWQKGPEHYTAVMLVSGGTIICGAANFVFCKAAQNREAKLREQMQPALEKDASALRDASDKRDPRKAPTPLTKAADKAPAKEKTEKTHKKKVR